MSLLNPFSGLQHLDKAPAFLRQLWADLATLREPDLPMRMPAPSRHLFADAAAHAAAVASLGRQWKFRVVRQAVRKAHIRTTLWRRLAIAYTLFGFVTVPAWSVVIFIKVASLLQHR